jgi:hypothetical protein
MRASSSPALPGLPWVAQRERTTLRTGSIAGSDAHDGGAFPLRCVGHHPPSMTEHRERVKVRVRVMRGSRSWRWKIIATIAVGVVLIIACATTVPRWLGSLVSESGPSAEPPPEPASHP